MFRSTVELKKYVREKLKLVYGAKQNNLISIPVKGVWAPNVTVQSIAIALILMLMSESQPLLLVLLTADEQI